MVAATAMPAIAPLERFEDELVPSGNAVGADVELADGSVVVADGVAVAASDVGALLAGLLAVDEELEVLVALELVDGASLPTADGPSVLPSSAFAARLNLRAVSPVRPFKLKRLE